jgi:hypothetical protein
MSADNGIYIGSFPTQDGSTEYRVIHAQAIENVDYGSTQEQDAYRFLYFGGAEVFKTLDETAALAEAHRQEAEILADPFCAVLEYGVNTLTFDRPLVMMTEDEAEKILGSPFTDF